MRLLHSRTLELQEFFENATPSYAILSHTWSLGEVTYQDMQGNNAKEKAGFIKIQNCCEQASRDGFDFVWVDTCCIDKTSSAELSEAINSMYTWYKNAKACYAYLADVPPSGLWDVADSVNFAHFAASRWFTRGWTLQELIAPPGVEFFAQDWTRIGTKDYLSHVISRITGIDEATLKGRSVKEVSVAKRMSWASKRVTTRIEDIAYCLIGIFGINLPLLYGEGERAFIRLQEEIMRSSDDQSLFAWEDKSSAQVFGSESGPKVSVSSEDGGQTEVLVKSISKPHPRPLRGFLARSPAEFENSGNIIPYRNWDVSMPYSMTNQGLRMQLSVLQYDEYDDFIGILACHYQDNFLGPLGVYIQPVASVGGDQFARDVSYQRPVLVVPEHVSKAIFKTVYIRQDVLLPSARDSDRRDHFLIRTLPDQDYALSKTFPAEHWNESQKIIRSPNRIGVLFFEYKGSFYVKKPLSFAVIIRSDTVQDGIEVEGPNYSCNIVVDPPIPDKNYLGRVAESTSPGTLQSMYEVLNPWNHEHEEKAFAKISREVFMGQAMFVVDITVLSTRIKKVPFFAAT
ncbi:hypothetical protein G7Y89_g6537 [Cudoniella acicularis]|uniref:Heterokaryon incompatibility domain-containing protein n=1 Tax=Cudoniella acicularis TaxID=354080 RepID=A0A8H4RMH7_9HELO|nr:hypothetical protein G7Y89_g6537 [Cudoniella acicularis]